MQHRTFGRLGWRVSEVGFGCWGMGGWTGSSDEESLAALEHGAALGCTFFDTALIYGHGRSERLVGRLLARHPDAPVRVATKIPPKNGQWPPTAGLRLDDVFPPDYIRASTEASLTNLGVSTLDLQQFHVWMDDWAGDARWQRAVSELKREGLVRGVGISVNRWQSTNVLAALRTGLIDSVQVVYNLFDQDPEDELFPVCRELGVAVIARVPFDEGSLTGALGADTRWPEGDFRNLYFPPERRADVLRRVEAVQTDVPAGMTLPELALRFVLQNPDVSTVVPGMRRVRHVEANLGVSDGRALPEDLLARLRRHRVTRTHVLP